VRRALAVILGLTIGASSLAWASLRLEWDYPGPGPVRFEVWHASTLSNWHWEGGTNVPAGFTLLTNTASLSVPLAAGMETEFFIVRAVNEFGVSDWAR
jgi:hypothetical protein